MTLIRNHHLLPGLLLLFSGSQSVFADVVRDGSIGPGVGTQPTGPAFVIDESMGQLNGANLFHSFSQFDLSSGQSASFTAVSSVDNVISRITGGTPSSIDGAVSSAIPGANLFLINPSGLVFGPNATVNVDGSFYVSTADHLRFDDATQFAAGDNGPALLTSAAPAAFGFLGNTSGSITLNRSKITVASGETIGLVANGITISDDGNFPSFSNATLLAPEGVISIQSVASAGEISVDPALLNTLQIPAQNADLHIVNSLLDNSGNTPGGIWLRGATLQLDASTVLSNMIGSGNAGDIHIDADRFIGNGVGGVISSTAADGNGASIFVDANSVQLNPGFALNASTEALATGTAGDINVTAREQILLDGGNTLVALSTESRGAGQAGNILLDAPVVMIDNAIVEANTLFSGDAGDIQIDAQQLDIVNGGRVWAANQGSGSGGAITLNASESIHIAGPVEPEIADIVSSETFGAGSAGTISMTTPVLSVDEAEIKVSSKGAGDAGVLNVQADRIELINGGQLSATTQFGGQGGNIQIVASTSLLISGDDGTGNGSGVFTDSRVTSTGDAGDISISTPTLILQDNGEILSDTLGSGAGGDITINAHNMTLNDDAEIASDVEGSGNGGHILINSAVLAMNDEAEISADTNPGSTGASGDVLINASEAVRMRMRTEVGEEAGIFTNSEGDGDAGDIAINTPLLSMDGAVLNALTAGDGLGGTIDLQVGRLALNNRAAISALSEGNGDAGNIRIRGADRVVVAGVSAITTESAVSNGGNITIAASDYVLLRDSQVTANVNDGVGGNITVSADTVALDQSPMVAQAGDGQGGAIVINANKYFNDNSLVSASAGPAGISGTVQINAPDIDLSGSMTRLKTEFVDAASLIASICAVDRDQRRGHFRVSQRRGLPSSLAGIPLPLLNQPELQLEVDDEQEYSDTRVIALSKAARHAMDLGDTQQAIDKLQQAQTRVDSLQPGAARWYSSIHLARSQAMLSAMEEKYKVSNLLHANRLLQQVARQALDRKDRRAAAFALGNQALLYQQQQRLAEALYLLRRAQHQARDGNVGEALYLWLWKEGEVLWMQGRSRDAIGAYQRAVDVLNETRQDALVNRRDDQAFFLTQIAPVYRDLADVLLQSVDRVEPQHRAVLLQQARATMNAFRAAELRNYFVDPCIADQDRDSVALDQVSPDAAIIYPMIMPDRLEILLSFGGELHRFKVAVDSRQLISQLRRFRIALQQPNSKRHRGYGKALYQLLVAPYESLLQQRDIKTLVYVMDGPLRTIPMAALNNGDDYLIDHYALATSVGLDLVQPRPLDPRQVQMLMAGISEPLDGFPALPYVPEEFDSLQQMFGGDVLLNQRFRLEPFRRALGEEQPNLVHLASHAKFSGKADSSFLLAYDGRITLNRMADYIGQRSDRNTPLELLVLSACETAAGDDRAALGLAGVGVKAGARSALGSLWSIPDTATYQLMTRFYEQLRQTGVSRAQALQRAQQALRDDPQFAHPFNWSAFLMINNWL